MTLELEVVLRWTSKYALSKGVRRVRVQQRSISWKDMDRWAFYADNELFEDQGAAISDAETRRTARRETLQRQIDKLNKPMRVIDKTGAES